MSEPQSNRRDEKQDEKNEKELGKRDEKTVEEKWRRDPLGTTIWALILIWAGVVFLADNLGLLSGLPLRGPGAWDIILAGAGVILLVEVAIRLSVPAYRRPVTGTVILAFIFIAIGLGNVTGWELVWPLILIAAGIAVLIGYFFRR